MRYIHLTNFYTRIVNARRRKRVRRLSMHPEPHPVQAVDL